MPRFSRTKAMDDAAAADPLAEVALPMLDAVAINVMYADADLVIRYVNPASLVALRKLEKFLPVAPTAVVGSSIDVFHKNPAHQRAILGAPSRLPHQARFQLGPEWLDLTAAAVRGKDGNLAGYLVNWAVVSDAVRIEREVQEISANLAASIEEMRASIREIAQAAGASAAVASTAADQASETGTLIGRLGEASSQISKVVDLIASVAENTNLLALNATIEAARAGEAGRGFAVVASEVKDLANETAKATEDITERIATIQREATAAADAIEAIISTIDSVRESASSIAAAVEEQSAASDEIARTAEAAAAIVSRQAS